MHGEKITAWCAIHSEGMLDLYYFNDETVRKEHCCELLNTYVRNERQNFPENALFQQYGAPAHTSRYARALLQQLLEENWMRKHGPVNWLPRSPDLTPPDFFLFRCM